MSMYVSEYLTPIQKKFAFIINERLISVQGSMRAKFVPDSKDRIIMTIKSSMTEQMITVIMNQKDDASKGGEIILSSRNPNTALYIAERYSPKKTITFGSAAELFGHVDEVVLFMNKKSPFSQSTYSLIKTSKGIIKDLGDDEVFMSKIVAVSSFEKEGVGHIRLQFENQDGFFIITAEEAKTIGNLIPGNFFCCNNKYNIVITSAAKAKYYFVM